MHEATLPPGTAAAAKMLAVWRATDVFYLAGGTALAWHLGQGQSRDLDFFTRDPQERLPARPDLDPVLAWFHSVEWDLKTAEQIQCRLDGVSVALLAYPGRRAQARDYLDLRAILTRGIVSPDDLLR